MFITKAFLFAALVFTAAHATPMPEAPVDEGFEVVDTKITEFGTVTYYRRTGATNTTAPALAPRACGSNDVSCDSNNVPDARACQILIQTLRDEGPERTADALCLKYLDRCCVSWHDATGPIQEQHLVNAAQAAYDGCVVRGLSGATSNTKLEGTCTRQCLSSRPEFC